MTKLPGDDSMDMFRRLIWRDTGSDPGELTRERRYAAKQWYHGELYGMLRIGKALVALALTASLTLAGCANSPLYRHSPEEARAVCEGYGFTRGTEGFAKCLQALDDRRANALSNVTSGLLFPR